MTDDSPKPNGAPSVDHQTVTPISPSVSPARRRAGAGSRGRASISRGGVQMRRFRIALLMAVGLSAAAVGVASAAPPGPPRHHHGSERHVLLISVDGLHQSDLAWWVRHNPHSYLALLSRYGA